ncbi:DUF3348 domain-containing protein [Paraburkholderia phenazinium]|uniref:DUF3348 domain-containing protein n=1 Tax=Paraburkholderia phenazinium TaxID=60549 RepID=A0A1G7TQS2_9BURK|nr:DUF3348 domain-containing protein [Paraburkholderia phenazinium]SDG37635.1 Protein of unknown function [Paraburkholderia phenazinium]
MVQVPQRTALSGPALIRLLARVTDLDVAESSQSLSDRLSQWLGWTDAIGLSTALNGSPPAVTPGARGFGSAEEDECARVRTSLVNSIAGESAPSRPSRRGLPQAPAAGAATEVTVDYAVFRHRYLSLQQSMETSIGNLRGRLRAILAAKTPSMARLAVVDAVMERALSPRERSLLASVPGMLAGHFERLRQAEQAALADAESAGEAVAVTPGAWLEAFRKDMQSVLLAELDVRFQPVEGLLAALRTR